MLFTFSKAYGLSDLPKYDHAAPGAGFDRLFDIIRELTCPHSPYQ